MLVLSVLSESLGLGFGLHVDLKLIHCFPQGQKAEHSRFVDLFSVFGLDSWSRPNRVPISHLANFATLEEPTVGE